MWLQKSIVLKRGLKPDLKIKLPIKTRTMETNELKDLWNIYDAKLERNWSLNLKLIKDMNLEKTKSSMNKFTFWKSMSLLLQFVVAHYLVNFIIDNYQSITLTLPAYLLALLTYIALIWNCYQLGLVLTINYSDAIISIQKKIEKLKIQKLRYNKFMFCASYPFVYLMGFTVLHIDLLSFPVKYLIPNLILALVWLPFCYWLIKKYNTDNLSSNFWKSLSRDSTLTPASVSKSLNNSLSFLQEIRNFEATDK